MMLVQAALGLVAHDVTPPGARDLTESLSGFLRALCGAVAKDLALLKPWDDAWIFLDQPPITSYNARHV